MKAKKLVGPEEKCSISEEKWKKKQRKLNKTGDAKAVTHRLPGLTDAQPVPEQNMTNLPKPSALCFVAERFIIGCGASLWLVRLICLAVSPPSHLPTPSLLPEVSAGEGEAWIPCKHCSETGKTLLCYQHCFGYKTQRRASYYVKINSIPDRLCTDGFIHNLWYFLDWICIVGTMVHI